jgi:hypothetical protein
MEVGSSFVGSNRISAANADVAKWKLVGTDILFPPN